MRFTALRCLTLWVPGWLAFVLVISILYVDGGSASESVALGSYVLLPISIWLTLATFNSERPDQRSAMAIAFGGIRRYRFSLSLTALFAALALIIVSIGYAVLRAPAGRQLSALPKSIEAEVCAALVGVAIGTVLARPTVRRPVIAFLVAIGACVLLSAFRLSPIRMINAATAGPITAAAVLVITAILAAALCQAVAALAAGNLRRR